MADTIYRNINHTLRTFERKKANPVGNLMESFVVISAVGHVRNQSIGIYIPIDQIYASLHYLFTSPCCCEQEPFLHQKSLLWEVIY